MSNAHGRPLVMVVEDDEEMNLLEQDLLDINGFDALPAHDGAEALELCSENDPDLVLLDAMLPKLDGFEVCRRLRRKDGSRPKVVMVTALASEEWRSRGYAMGAEAYFTKPFNPDALVGTLRSLITPDGGLIAPDEGFSAADGDPPVS